MASKRRAAGRPAKPDDGTAELFHHMKGVVQLVAKLDGRLTTDNHLKLKAAALGLMWAYSELAGLPAPDEYAKVDAA